MKNKLYRINHRPGRYIELAETQANRDASFERRQKTYKQINTLDDTKNFKQGFILGIQNIKIDENEINNIFFQRGYALGQRKYNAIEEEKQQKIIAAFVELDIPLEECPDHIKNNTRYKTSYTLKLLKKRI